MSILTKIFLQVIFLLSSESVIEKIIRKELSKKDAGDQALIQSLLPRVKRVQMFGYRFTLDSNDIFAVAVENHDMPAMQKMLQLIMEHDSELDLALNLLKARNYVLQKQLAASKEERSEGKALEKYTEQVAMLEQSLAKPGLLNHALDQAICIRSYLVSEYLEYLLSDDNIKYQKDHIGTTFLLATQLPHQFPAGWIQQRVLQAITNQKDMYVSNSEGNPLLHTIKSGNDSLADAIIEKTTTQSLLYTSNNKKQNALHLALELGKEVLATKIIGKTTDYANFYLQTDEGASSLMWAVCRNRQASFNAIVDKTSNENNLYLADTNNLTPLHFAAKFGRESMGFKLLKATHVESNIYRQDDKGNTALMLAAANGSSSSLVVEILARTTEQKFIVMENSEHQTALSLAAINGNNLSCAAIAKHISDPTVFDKELIRLAKYKALLDEALAATEGVLKDLTPRTIYVYDNCTETSRPQYAPDYLEEKKGLTDKIENFRSIRTCLPSEDWLRAIKKDRDAEPENKRA